MELKRWRAKTWEQLLADVEAAQAYEVEFESRKYQVEVEILENTEKYVHVAVSVDDGTLPASVNPLSESFICKK
jgi:DNA relaxase NicK